MTGHADEKAATKLTPTEELVMEVLAARHRLGETLWTFDSTCGRAIDSLATKGLVVKMHGTVERTVRASLTEAGRAEYVTAGYRPPILDSVLSEDFVRRVLRETIGTPADTVTRREAATILRIAADFLRRSLPGSPS